MTRKERHAIRNHVKAMYPNLSKIWIQKNGMGLARAGKGKENIVDTKEVQNECQKRDK